MPEYLSPGVYVEEIDTGSKPIEGVSTSTAGMVGVTERGPVDVPILVTSYGEFTRLFGERLRVGDFSNANGRQCYFPQAVEGFFVNGGKRVYAVRVLDRVNAVRAQGFLFDRGTAASANTLLLRGAGELTGTAANPPLLVVLDASALAANDWVRIGDGSQAEYAQVDVAPVGENTVVPLHLPLSRTHANAITVEQIARTPAGGALTLVADPVTGIAPGTQTIVIDGANADITFLNTNPNQLLEIGGAVVGEYRFATGVSNVQAVSATNSQATINLDSPLSLPYANGAGLTRLNTGPVTANSTAASVPGAGDRIVFVANRAGQFNNRANLVVLESANPPNFEVRRIGALRELAIGPGAYEEYPAGTLVEAVTLAPDSRTLAAPLPAATDPVITLSTANNLTVGQTLVIGPPGPGQDTRVIIAINTGANQVTLASPLSAGHVVGDPVVTGPRTLTAPSTAGALSIALSNRVGLAVGDVIRVGTAPNDEYVTIVSLPARAPAGSTPDAGNVMITPALSVDHALGTPVVRPLAPALVAGRQATVLALAPAARDPNLLVTDGVNYALGEFVRVTTSSGEVFYHTLTAAPAIPTPDVVTLRTALRRAHPAGSGVLGRAPVFEIEALDAGAWGNRLRVSVEDEGPGLVNTTLLTITNPTHIRLTSAAGVEAGSVLELTDPLNGNAVVGNPIKVVSIDRTANFTLVLDGPGMSALQQTAEANAVLAGRHLGVRSREFRVTVFLFRQPDPALPSRNETILNTEVFRYLSMDHRHSRYFEKVIGSTWNDIVGVTDDDGLPPRPLRRWDHRSEGESWYVRVHDLALDLAEPNRTNTLESVRLGPETLVDILPSGRRRPARHALEARLGDDSVATIDDATYVGQDDPDPDNRTGLQSLRNIEEVSIVAAPGRTSAALQGALIDHCELMRYRFAVLDGELPPTTRSPTFRHSASNLIPSTPRCITRGSWCAIRSH
jgi:phage tail sheath protein FI